QPGFAELTTSMPGFKESTLACGDYDNDGYQDVVIAGVTTPGVHTGLYKNVSAGGDSGEREFIDSGVPLSGVRRGAVAFGDVDNDGDLDILLSGLTRENEAVTEIFVNDNGFFRMSTAALDGVREASVAWGDYDNDGWSDILMAGLDNLGQPVTRLYRNLYGTAHEIQFARIRHTLPGISSGAVAWGDYDRNKDGVEDLDILVTGAGQSGGVSKIFRNNNRRKRSAPAVPGKLSARITFDAAELRWEAPDSTMNSYNVRIGVTAEGGEISSGMANPVDGFRKIPARGNVKGNTFLQVNGLENRTYHWTVQAIDPAFAGSAFAPENEFAICDSLIEKFEVVDSTDASLTLEVSLAVPAETIAIRYGSDKSSLTELPVHLTNTTGGLVTVPGLEQNTRYYFKLRVNDRTTFVDLCTLESARTRVRAWSEAFSGSDKVRTITTDDRYTLVGIPYEADANRMSLVFQREQYDKTKLRVFRVNKSADGYEELQADWQNETLKPGYSYLVSSRARLAIDAGVGNSVEDRPFVPVRVNHDPRVPGPVWFMMANPFSTDMPITQILDSDLLAQENVFRFDSGRRSDPWQIVEDGVVRAYGAYLICLKTGGDILIRNAPEGQRSEVKKRTQHDLWKVKLNLQDNAGRPHLLYAGSHEEASMSRDFYDILAPPPWNRSVDAYFLNDSLPGGYFIGDFRPPGQPYYGFRFFISAHGEGPFQLAIEPEGLPVNFDILLVDETNNVAVDPGQVFFHEIDNTFKMVVARQEEIAKQKQTLKVIPEHFQVHQNFPNPFNASTFISYDLPAYTRVSVAIYNVLGQKVRSLVSNQVQIGSQQVIWDGHDDSRMPVASGIYVVRIASEFGTLARKMSLLR
ncbi:MAG: FG-GAP-like repeat-containing protein, partial [bacterium]